MPKLQDFVERDNISGLIVPSIHAFSGTKEKIKELFEQSLKSGQQILFADENILLKDEQELEVIFQILNLEK
jgi:trans-2-enoyl-CoA reductase